ncbi:TonB-dependent receptor [Dysgonomonas sp. Marseille-P4677]|uniref:SusC/RagA family TonB-linked outer membrane protein n=1 Tax=Dysgonomonas sp. Marseille-P4677 TaxID=2364790 RepID=UPI00191196F6|nr:TonB-dependent receptor [Dysgonomonas sp. Marseille-P4677]MBK5719866.1 TonB-dependent receptor [Dysgonomonas sp. Marseille-P4677]
MKRNKKMSISLKRGALFIVGWMCFGSVVLGQTITVKGTVTDRQKEPLVRVTVQTVAPQGEQSTVAFTDMDGNFTLANIASDAKLKISYIGMESQVVSVNGRTSINIILNESEEYLNEIHIHGYGNLTRDEETSSTSSIKMGDMAKERPAVSISDLMQGQAAGLQIINNSGVPGSEISMHIRGINSFGNHDPLVVIDGVIMEGSGGWSGGATTGDISQSSASPFLGNSALASINPNDVASIEVLKDAAATAIYGSRAANGVILITTKEGVPGKSKVEYNFNMSTTKIGKHYELLSSKDYMDYYNEAYKTEEERGTLGVNVTLPFPEEVYEKNLGIDTDWQDEIFRTGVSMDHQISVSGGDKFSQYLVSGGYTKSEGIIKTSQLDRYSARINYNRTLSEKVRATFNASYSDTKNQSVPQSVPAASNQAALSVISSALAREPFNRVTEEGEYISEEDVNNPLSLLHEKKDIYIAKNLMGRLNLSYEMLTGLVFKLNVGYTRKWNTRDAYFGRGTIAGRQAPNGYAIMYDSESSSLLSEYTVSYNGRVTKKSRLNLVGGFSWQETESRSKSISASDFPSDISWYYNLSSAGTVQKPITSFPVPSRLASFIGRAIYTYDSRYVFAFSGRYDGSSRLAPANRWNFFPALSGAWNIDREKFMRKNKTFSQMKFRLGWGITGNQSVSAGSSQAIYGGQSGAFGNKIIAGYFPGRFENPYLKWEKTYQWNVGVDVGILKNRFKFTANYYNKKTVDLIGSAPIPASTGYTAYTGNMGKIRNEGIELEGNGQIIESDKNQFTWEISANIAFNRNKILSLGDVEERIASRNYFGSVSTHSSRVGGPMYMFIGYLVDGVYQNQQEADAGPKDEVSPINYPGALKFVDSNGDNRINTADLVELGSPFPDYTLGISNTLGYQNFHLTIFVNGSIGNKIANLTRYRMDGLVASNRWNTSREAYENAWRGEGKSNTYTRPVLTSNQPYNGRLTNLILEDGTYVRLKNVTLSYDIPLAKLGVKFMTSAKVFATGTNLVTFTKYSGYDPEVSGVGSNSPGVDFYTAPQGRTFTFGINIVL